MRTRRDKAHPDTDALRANLRALNLPFMLENHQTFAQTAADKQWSHLHYLTELIDGEAAARDDRRVQRCIALARFPVPKTLDQFDWHWPTKINRLLIQNLFHLDFVKARANVVFISGTGLGKSHLMTALGHAACLRGCITMSNLRSCALTNWAICRSISSAQTACSRSSATDMSAVPP
jgi:DNA replication protein DnaC